MDLSCLLERRKTRKEREKEKVREVRPVCQACRALQRNGNFREVWILKPEETTLIL